MYGDTSWPRQPGHASWTNQKFISPCINVSILQIGLLRRLLIRIYFAGDPRNGGDPTLLGIVDTEHRNTLLAGQVTADPAGSYRFDIVMQGGRETANFVD